MLRIALIGAWHVHFHEYASDLAGRDDCVITALWDDDPARGRECAEKYHCEYLTDYDALLRRDDVDAVAVCSATSQHPELIIKAANAKKHIFTEKVLSFTARDAKEIQKAVEKSGVKFCISFPKRAQREILFAKKLVEDSALGQITYARVRNAHNGASAGWLPEHFYDEAQCGGGAMMDLGAHPMYLLSYLMGRPVAVTSMFTNVTGRAVEDNAVTLIEFENKAIGSSETGFVSQNDPFQLELTGTKGTLLIKDGETLLNLDGRWTAPKKEEMPAPLLKAPHQWVEAILSGGEIAFGIADAVAVTELMEAAYLSHKEGRRVSMKEIVK